MVMSSLYLLDTHVLIFWNLKQSISPQFIEFLESHQEQSHISWVSIWEMAYLSKKGKIKITNIDRWANEFFENTRLTLLYPTFNDIGDALALPDHHKDPFDRMLIAQAVNHQMVMISKDQEFKKYDVPTLWQD